MADDAEGQPRAADHAAANDDAPALQHANDDAILHPVPPPAELLDDQLAQRHRQMRERWRNQNPLDDRQFGVMRIRAAHRFGRGMGGGQRLGGGGGGQELEDEAEDGLVLEDQPDAAWWNEEEERWERLRGFGGGFGGDGAGFGRGGGFGGGGQRLGGGWERLVEDEAPPIPPLDPEEARMRELGLPRLAPPGRARALNARGELGLHVPVDEEPEGPQPVEEDEGAAVVEGQPPVHEAEARRMPHLAFGLGGLGAGMEAMMHAIQPDQILRDEQQQQAGPPAAEVRDRVLQRLQGVVHELLDVREDLQRMQIDGHRTVITAEVIRDAAAMGDEDTSNPSTARYSRNCDVCGTENPRKRAVFTKCGHIVCYPCAVKNATGPHGGKCVHCRATSGFVKIFENEIEKEDDKKDENPQDGE